jgi:ribosomal protein S18 acetylase RimI-like enzyme
MTVRAAVPADLDAIMALERASFPTDAWSDAMMREELASPHGWYIVDEVAGRVAGYAGLRAVRGAKDADVQTIAIAEASRGRGRGRALLRALLTEAARRGVHGSSSRSAPTTPSRSRSTPPRGSTRWGAGRATTSPTTSTPS